MSFYSLGISYGHHESSICLIGDDFSPLYIREEWISRVKGDSRFPHMSLDYLECLLGGLRSKITCVCLHEKPLATWLGSGLKVGQSQSNYLLKIRQFKSSNVNFEKEVRRRLGSKTKIYYSSHHLSHALTSELFDSGNREKLLHLVMDGYGEGLSGALMLRSGDDLTVLEHYLPSNSLGLVYSAITSWAGFTPNEDEFKVMAMAAYGDSHHLIGDRDFFQVTEAGIEVKSKYFCFDDVSDAGLTEEFFRRYGYPLTGPTRPGRPEFQETCNVVLQLQAEVEDTVLRYVESVLNRTEQVERLHLSGGLFHNSRLVGYLSKRLALPIFVGPSPGDAGSSIGASYFGFTCEGLTPKFSVSPFIGPRAPSLSSYSTLFSVFLEGIGVSDAFQRLVQSGEVIATYSQNMEVGPRALGARSLLCDATNLHVVRELNAKMKGREEFRPLAIMVSETDANGNFDLNPINALNCRWMGMLVNSKEDGLWKMGEVCTHVDGTSRIQVIANTSAEVERVVTDYVCNVGPLVNTSLNFSRDPMVFSPEDLYVTCNRLGVRYVLNNGVTYRVNS